MMGLAVLMPSGASRGANCPIFLNCPKETPGCVISVFLPSGERRDRIAPSGAKIAIYERLNSRATYCITPGTDPDINCRRLSFTAQELECLSGNGQGSPDQVQFFKCKKAAYTYIATDVGCREAGGTVGEPQ